MNFTAPITDLGSELDVSNGSVLNLTGQSFSLTTLDIYSSTLNGAGGASLTVSGTMTWDNGTVTGFGALDIPSGATANLGGGLAVRDAQRGGVAERRHGGPVD